MAPKLHNLECGVVRFRPRKSKQVDDQMLEDENQHDHSGHVVHSTVLKGGSADDSIMTMLLPESRSRPMQTGWSRESAED